MPDDTKTPDNTPNPNPNLNPAAPPADAPNPLVDAAAAAAKEREWVPVDLRSHKSLTKFKAPGDVAQAYVNLEKKLGERVAPPGDDATPEAKAAWRAALGVPADANGYEKPSLPEGSEIELDAEYIGSFHSKAHEIGLTPAQAKALQEWVIGREVSAFTDMKANTERAKTEGMKSLRTMWGAATAENVGLIQRLVAETADEKVKAALDRTGFGNDPEGLRWMAKIARQYADHDLIDPKMARTSTEEAATKIKEIKEAARKDKKHPYVNESHPGHKAAVDEMNTLYQIAYPDVEFSVGV